MQDEPNHHRVREVGVVGKRPLRAAYEYRVVTTPDLTAEHLRNEIRLLAEALPRAVRWREEPERDGAFAFTFEAEDRPSLAVAGGADWFNLFYGSAGFEQSMPDRSTADWVLAICDSVFAGRVRQSRTGRFVVKYVAVFELCTRGVAQTVTETTWGFDWPWREHAAEVQPPSWFDSSPGGGSTS